MMEMMMIYYIYKGPVQNLSEPRKKGEKEIEAN